MSNVSNTTSTGNNDGNLVTQYVQQMLTAKIVLMSIALALSCSGVFIITFTIFKIKRLLNFTNVLVLNLCWSSLLLALCGLINALSETTAGYQIWTYGEFACRFLKSLLFVISVVIAYSLVAISYARFRIIGQPFLPPPERHYAYYVIAAVWVTGIACGTPYFVTLTVRTIRNQQYCTFSSSPVILDQNQLRAYLVALTIIIFVLPFLLQAGLNLTIAIQMNKSGKAKIFIDPKDDKIAGVKRKLTYMSIFLVVIFFLTWLPYFIVVLLQTFGRIESIIYKPGDNVAVYFRKVRDFILIRDFLLGLIYCSSIFNLSILYFFNPHFKAALKRALFISTPGRRARVDSEITVTERSMSVVSSMMAGKIDMKY